MITMKTIDLIHWRTARTLAPSKENVMYVIAGVTGRTGSVVASTLLAAGQPVRVLVRDSAKGAPWAARGADVAVAAMEDRAALARALAGAAGAYLLVPPVGWTETDIPRGRATLTASMLAAVREARPAHVVLLSSIGAEVAAGTGPIQYVHRLEADLVAAEVPSTFLRAAAFMENWVALARGAIEAGALYYGQAAGVRLDQVATADIGRVAARLLVEDPPATARVVQLAGPAELTLSEIAAVIGSIAGRPVAGVSVPPEATIDAMVGMGASREAAAMYAELTTAMNDGTIRWQGTDIIRGSTTLEQCLRPLLS
jgi:uncharacterized protein YbjT (DUF2867 family)